MHSSWSHVILIAQYFTILFTRSYGKLDMVKYSLNNTNEYSYQCITANDGSALTWNIEPDGAVSELDSDSPRYNCVGVVLGLSDRCLSEKDASGGFNEVSSIEYPMGPVFDYRWEGFEETNSSIKFNVQNMSTIVFSVRTSKNFDVLFTGNNFTSSVPKVTFDMSKQCGATFAFGDLTNNSNHEPVLKSPDDSIKWRTYIIKWNEWRKIEVFENGTTTQFASPNFNESLPKISNMHFHIPRGARLRLHRYRYFLTKKANSKLQLDNFPQPRQQFCVHLVISLCEECQFEVRINHSSDGGIKTNFTRKGSSNSGLPFWQIETINVTLNTTTTISPSVVLFTKTTRKNNTDGRWAFGGMPYCKSRRDFRYIVSEESWHTNLIFKKINDQKLPKVVCEKLFYTENLLVNSKAKITSVAPEVARSKSQTYSKFGRDHYKKMMICDPLNCFCEPGFIGSDCDQECLKGNYGYDCQNTCTYCSGKSCDNVMGKCNSKCTGDRIFPDCKKLLQKPKVVSSRDTSAILQFDDRLDKEETHNFRIEFKNLTGDPTSALFPIDFDRNPPYTETLDALVPCTTYEVWYAVGNLEHTARSHKQKFTTQWNSPRNLTVEEKKFGCIKLTWLHDSSSEKQPIFNVSYHQLSTTLKDRITLSSSRQHKDNRTAPTYGIDLCLLTASKYNLTITVTDDNFECRIAREAKTYSAPPNPSFGKAELQVSRNDLDSIELIIPPVINDTDQSTINVDVMTKPNCSMSNIRRYISKSANETGAGPLSVTILENGSLNLNMKRNTELCQLLPDESYDVQVTVRDGDSRQSLSGKIESLPTYLSLIIGIVLAFVICAMFAYIVYLRYKVVRSKVESHALDETIQTTKVPYASLYNQYARVEKLKAFEKEVKKSVENGVLLQQFEELPRGLVRPCKIGILPKNRSKNRYGNLVAYDDTRVILGGGCSGDDYINANYIHGYCKEKAYIATQAPIPETVDDFWRMIWQEEVTIICMLVGVEDGDKKVCEQYWPKNVKAKKDYGDYIICNMEERVYPSFTHRRLLMVTCYDEKSRMIEHLQFTEWSDEEVPVCSHSVVEYLNKLRSMHTRGEPIVVHCSSGVGRTGTMILCDISTRHIAAKGTVDMLAEARKMFEARANMLSNYKQFVLTHLVATQYLLQPATKIPYEEITREKIEQFKNDLPMLISRLEDCSWMAKSMYYLDPVKPLANENILKNRFRKLIPVSSRLVILERYPTHDIHSDYISAVSVDGVNGKQYITSQLPLPSTLTDFWRLIIEKKVGVVVILQRPDPENNDSCCDVVPRGTLIPIPNVTVNTESSSNANKFFTMDTLWLTNTLTVPMKKRKIITLTCENWSLDEDAKPPKPEALVELWIAADRVWHRGPILVLCYDGVKGCGLYVAMSYMLDRMSSERECDVISATKAVQRSRQEFMTAQWQFEYLYDAAVQHAEAFKTYANVI